jgi:hypothetical protein
MWRATAWSNKSNDKFHDKISPPASPPSLLSQCCVMKHALLGTGSAQKELVEQQGAPGCSRVVMQQGATGSSRVCSCVRSADTRPRAVQGGQGGAGKGTHDTRRVDFCQRVLRPPPLSPYPAALPSPSAPPPVAKQDKTPAGTPLVARAVSGSLALLGSS